MTNEASGRNPRTAGVRADRRHFCQVERRDLDRDRPRLHRHLHGQIGTTYHAFTRHESVTYVEHATSASLDGPWNFIGTNDWAGWTITRKRPA